MFDIHQSVRDEEYDGYEEKRVEEYTSGLMQAFAESPEAKPLIESGAVLGWARHLLHYYFGYIGASFPQMTRRDHDEVVFELFPRKISTEAESAPEIITELRAFWGFLDRQYALPNAKQILETLTDDAVVRLKRELSNPRNFGMAKSFFMLGQQAGFDMTTQEGLDEFVAAYNSGLVAGRAIGMPTFPSLSRAHDAYVAPVSGSDLRPIDRERKRKARKAQRQARKRNRR
jgi:hypothetical protein